MAENTSIIIVGQPGTSKTTFLSQLFLQVSKQKKKIKFRNRPENISILNSAINDLRQGKSVQATPSEINADIEFPLIVDDKHIDLFCPDYAGEQISQFLDVNIRAIDDKWVKLITQSDGWIIFIRPSLLVFSNDISKKSISEAEKVKVDNNEEFKLSDQSSLIELLQILRFYKKLSVQQRTKVPKLLIAYTCWDELEETTPLEYTKRHLPLFYEFIKNNWEQDSFSFCGVSAQGGKIEDVKGNYEIEGPEEFAYIIAENGGDKIFDLSLLITKVL